MHQWCTPAGSGLKPRLGTVSVLALGLCAWGGVAVAQRRPDRLVIATFNAEWLFDGVGDNARSPWQNRPAEATDHMRAVGDVIRQMDADIVKLVEVEDLAVLQRL